MSYALMMGPCFACGQPFSFNPIRVPSFRDQNGTRQPVCEHCMNLVNAKREQRGLPKHTWPADAYEACAEEELP